MYPFTNDNSQHNNISILPLLPYILAQVSTTTVLKHWPNTFDTFSGVSSTFLKFWQ